MLFSGDILFCYAKLFGNYYQNVLSKQVFEIGPGYVTNQGPIP